MISNIKIRDYKKEIRHIRKTVSNDDDENLQEPNSIKHLMKL
jgi:hypothetical protein